MAEFRYQIGLMGQPWFDIEIMQNLLSSQLTDLGISPEYYEFLDEALLPQRDVKSPFVCIFFGYDHANRDVYPDIFNIFEDSLPIIPVVSHLKNYSNKVPSELNSINGLAIGEGVHLDFSQLLTCVLENLSLLRKDRRIFISYRRDDTREIALQLYDAFQSQNFDTFLDTHSIQPAVNMQDNLWHRLADSDVVVLLDSPNFRMSKWTMLEQAQANATSIQILHVLWPSVDEDPYSALSEFLQLGADSFRAGKVTGKQAKLRKSSVDGICAKVESIRAKALAFRHAYLVDQFCDICRDNGIKVNLHPQRYISTSDHGVNAVFVPAIGVPNAYRINQIESAITERHSSDAVVNVIYDNRGLLDSWTSHLVWLNSHLKIKVLSVVDLKNMKWSKA